MGKMHEIRLELVRPGPSHNQLLSPLTQYTALCGDGEPITFSIELEQHELMDILARLRYYQQDGSELKGVPESVREATVKEIGRHLQRLFGKLTNVLVEEGRAFGQLLDADRWDKDPLIHLRLVSSASELSYVPFEMAISPAASPSEGSKMFVNATLPMVITREIRRSRPAPINWNTGRATKLLVIAAQPGFLRVPLEAHLKALSTSLEPWVERKDTEEDKLDALKQCLRVLPNASLEDIYQICSKEKFTHVHILAHGGEYQQSREKRFGLLLCNPKDKTQKHYVSADRLANAIQAQSEDGSRRSNPQMVTLATCDSGAQGSLLIPGGSIAHELHLAGIPVVVASQFPLTKLGSTTLVSELYPRILRGDDPRRAAFEVRRILCTLHDRSHDWGSLVVYASLPDDFDEQVKGFSESRCKAAIDVALKHADKVVSAKAAGDGSRADDRDSARTALAQAEKWLAHWQAHLEDGNAMQHRIRRAEYHGICGSAYKRYAMLYAGSLGDDRSRQEFESYMGKAMASYQRAIAEWATDESKFHWVATQALSTKIILAALDPQSVAFQPDEDDLTNLNMARKLAEIDAQMGHNKRTRAWGYATLAELHLLCNAFGTTPEPDRAKNEAELLARCRDLLSCSGKQDFPAQSTARQFDRYVKLWGGDEYRKYLVQIAEDAVKQLRE